MRIGIDLGGTKIEIIAIDDDGAERLRRRTPTPVHDYALTLKTLADLIQTAENELHCKASIGIGTPGALSPDTGLMRNSNSTCLNGKPLDLDLEALLKRPIRLQNDANCFALSEATDGAAAGAHTVFAVIIGTGTGAGITIAGSLINGPNAVTGEWGHNPLPWPNIDESPGSRCYCGNAGCIETFLSGPGLARDYANTTSTTVPAHTLETLAEQGDTAAQQALNRYEDRMARSLATVINLLDPDVIVLGGGVSNMQRLYTNVPKQWHKYVFADRVRTKLLPARHGDSSGVRGAAWLWRL